MKTLAMKEDLASSVNVSCQATPSHYHLAIEMDAWLYIYASALNNPVSDFDMLLVSDGIVDSNVSETT